LAQVIVMIDDWKKHELPENSFERLMRNLRIETAS
jgi:hypothetical protein